MTTKKRDKPQLATWDFNKLVEYSEAYILKEFINEGGKGFHFAVWRMLELAMVWEKYQPKRRKL